MELVSCRRIPKDAQCRWKLRRGLTRDCGVLETEVMRMEDPIKLPGFLKNQVSDTICLFKRKAIFL